MGNKPLESVFDSVSVDAIVDFAQEHSDRDGEVDLRDSAYILRPNPEH